MDEAEPQGLRLAPCSRPPGYRQTKPENRNERPAGHHFGRQAPLVVTPYWPNPDVVREEPRPALDIAGEAEHETRRGRDIDR